MPFREIGFLTESVSPLALQRIGPRVSFGLYFWTVYAHTIGISMSLRYNQYMMKKISSAIANDYERPFFIFLTIILIIIYVQSVTSNVHLRQPVMFAFFTLLMAVHIILYWMMTWILRHTARAWIALVIQGLLAYILVIMAQTIGIAFGLFPGLIGLAIGINRSWRAVFPVAYFLGLSLLSALTVVGSSAMLLWAVGVIPASLFAAIYVALYARQSEARERAQALAEELEAANRQLSEYTARVEDLTIAAERQRMARELHDSLSQGLAGLILQLEAADAHLTSQRSEKARLIIQQAMQRARLVLSDARRIIGDLRENDMGDLRESLQREISRFENATGISCAFHADLLPPLPESFKETILRIVSEALTNTAQHARASQASLTLTVASHCLTVEIKDNGTGFDPSTIPAGHYGILGIRERIRLIGGTLALTTAPQKGTIWVAEIPLPAMEPPTHRT